MNRKFLLPAILSALGLLVLVQVFSCIRPPFFYSMDESLPIKEEDITDAAQEILDKLAEAKFILEENDPTDLVPGAQNITYGACILEFKKWIERHYDNGLIPTIEITGLEYTDKKTPNYQEYVGCPIVDMKKQYLEAANDAMRKNKNLGNAIPMSFSDQGDSFYDDVCLQRFVKEDSQLVGLLEMMLSINKNTLNVPGPIYTLYYYKREIEDEELEEEGAKEKLLSENDLFEFGHTRPILPGTKGTLKIDLIKDEVVVSQALTNILTYGMVAWPSEVITNAKPIQRGGESFFVVPQGSVDARMKLLLELTLTSDFFSCLRREKTKEWKEDQEIKKEEYEEELKNKDKKKGNNDENDDDDQDE